MRDTEPTTTVSHTVSVAPTISDTAMVDTVDAHIRAADPHPPRRPDAVLITRRLAEASVVVAHRTLREVRVALANGGERVLDARMLSDHLPVEVDFAFAA